MNIVICDDESVYRKSIIEKIQNWARNNYRDEMITVRSFSSSEELLDAWEKGMRIDMLFLDIQIPHELSGMEIAKRINSIDEYIPIVFVTNYIEYACEGYLVNALRYVMKPIEQGKINECMDIAWNRWQLLQAESLRIESGKQIIIMPIKNIVMIESFGHILRIYSTTISNEIEVRARLKEYVQKLPKGMFSQCHKSYVVNIMFVRKIRSNEVTLASGKSIPLGRKFAMDFLAAFNNYYQGA